MEAGLDNLMTTLETDCGITADGIPLLSHDPHIQAQKCRRVDGQPYNFADEVLIKFHRRADSSDLPLRQAFPRADAAE